MLLQGCGYQPLLNKINQSISNFKFVEIYMEIKELLTNIVNILIKIKD